MSNFEKYFSFFALVIATILFAIGPAIVKLLVTMGGTYGIKYPGAISFCNVLFVGNLCAGLVAFFVFNPKKIIAELVRMPAKMHLLLFCASIATAMYPSLLFIALEHTTVINLVLISRFNGIVYLIFAFIFLGTRLGFMQNLSYIIMAVAVAALIIISNKGFHIGLGDALILSATIFFAITEILSRKILPNCSIGTYIFVRNFSSAVLFFIAVIILFGIGHFMTAFTGELWELMLVYAGVAIVLAQLFWLYAVKRVPNTSVANIKLFDPVFSITFAYFLLAEKPTTIEWVAMAVIAVAMLLPKFFGKKPAAKDMLRSSIDTGLVGK